LFFLLSNVEAVKFLVSQNVSIQTEGVPDSESVLVHAVQMDGPDMLEALLKSPGINVNVRSEAGWPVFFEAMRRHGYEVAEKLLAAGADPNTMSSNQLHTALLIATFEEWPDIVRLLVRYGADVNLENCHRENPLTTAVCRGKLPCIICFIEDAFD